jgi:hypothetical protein
MDRDRPRPKWRPLIRWVIVFPASLATVAGLPAAYLALIEPTPSREILSDLGLVVGLFLAVGVAMVQLEQSERGQGTELVKIGWSFIGSAMLLLSSYSLRNALELIFVSSPLGRVASALIWCLVLLTYTISCAFSLRAVGGLSVIVADRACPGD